MFLNSSKIDLRGVVWALSLAMTAVAAWLHFYSFFAVGGLWRDEVGLVNIAALSSWHEVVWGLMHDHCPVAFAAVVRLWKALGLAQGDNGFRVLGLVIGILMLGSFWAVSRMMGGGLPLLALSVAALNPVVIRYGDSMRGYGLGVVVITVTMGMVWRFVRQPSLLRGTIAAIAAILSVQTLYQNGFFLLAICAGAIVVSLRQRQSKTAAGVLLIGFLAALSLLPYVQPILDAQSWWVVARFNTSPMVPLANLMRLLGGYLSLWVLVVVAATVAGLMRFFTAAPTAVDMDDDIPLFAGIALALGAVGFALFIGVSGLPTQVWYYIPLLCFTMVCCDGVFPRIYPAIVGTILLIAACSLLLSSPAAYSALHARQTNADLWAAELTKEAVTGDLIIVHPWYLGLTFSYYYHGDATWKAFPPIADYRFHRYDLIKEKLADADAIIPVLAQMEATLRSNHRVWLLGSLPAVSADAPPPVDLPAAPGSAYGWQDTPYSNAWGTKARYFLQHHAGQITPLPEVTSAPVNPDENLSLSVASGWHE